MIHTVTDLLDDYIIPVGESIKGLDLEEEAKTLIFVKFLEDLMAQTREAEIREGTND